MAEKFAGMKWFLLITTTFASFTFIVLIIYKDVPTAISSTVFTLIGIVVGKWGTMVDWNFGSSTGSAHGRDLAEKVSDEQSKIIAKMTGTGDGITKTDATIKTEVKSETIADDKKENG